MSDVYNEDLKNLEVAFGWHGARSWREHFFFNLNPLKLGPNGFLNAIGWAGCPWWVLKALHEMLAFGTTR